MEKYITIKEASELICVTTTTIRRCGISGQLVPSHRTKGNHRRYRLKDVLEVIYHVDNESKDVRITVCYARVSSQDQNKDLVR